MASAAPELAVSALTVRFGALTALEGVNLALRAGEVVALAGENGAGKTTLIRAIAGDVTPASGSIRVSGQAVTPTPNAAAKLGVRVVWQDLALADNLNVAANVMLGNEKRRHLFSEVALHKDAARLLDRLGIPLRDTTRPVGMLSGAQRQMVAVARAMAHNPRILLLDEPTAALGVQEAALVERLITRLRARGTTIVLACHDTELMFRLADRIVVLRRGRVVTEVAPSEVHPDDVVALISGQAVDSSARRQLTRLHGLTGRLVSSDPSSSLSLILSALGAAIGSERLAIHLLEDGELVRAASLGMPDSLIGAWARLPVGTAGGPVGLAAERQVPVIEDNLRTDGGSWQVFGNLARPAKVASSWSVPVLGPGGLLGVITVFRAMPGLPRRDDLDLAALYAGYAASAIERDRLLDEVTVRNRLLETHQGGAADPRGPGAGGGRAAHRAARPAGRARRRRGHAAQGIRRGDDLPRLLQRGFYGMTSTAAADAGSLAYLKLGIPGAMREAPTALPAAMVDAARAALDRSDPDGVAVAGIPCGPRERRERCAPVAASCAGTGQPGGGQPGGPAQPGAGQPGAGQLAHGPGSRYLSVPRSSSPDGRGPCCWASSWRDGAQVGRRDRPARGRRQLAAARARARAGAARTAGGDGAAAVARAAADVPALPATSCAPRSPRSPGTRPACCSRTSPGTRTVAAAVPATHRRRVGAARPPGQRPARLLHHRARHPAAEQ